MKSSSSRIAPRRSSWKRRGALFGVCVALGSALLITAPRLASQFSLFSAAAPAPIQNPALEAKRNRSLTKALEQIDAKTIAAYVERWTNPEKSAGKNLRRAVRIDTETLARRHPAWQLASEVERGGVSPSNPRIARILGLGAARNSLSSDFAAPIARGANSADRVVPGVVVAESGARFSSQTAPNRALNAFLAQNAARDARRARDEAFLAQRSLEGATELARRRAVAELDLPALSPETALELLNLRLELLRNLSRTPAQRAETREEIRAIEARYAALLAQQTREQAARLRAATVDLPDQTRREGLERIERVALVTAQSQAQTRRALARENQNRWRRDAQASGDSLRVALPPVRRASTSQSAVEKGSSPATRAKRDFFETAPLQTASNGSIELKTGVSSADRRVLAARLRAQARADAKIWARSGATRLGAVWSQNASAPDATAQVLQIVAPRVSP